MFCFVDLAGKRQTDRQTHTHSIHINTIKNCKTVIPFGQTLRLRRIRSEQDNLQKRCQELKHHLMDRGYDEQQLDSEIQLALDILREMDSQPRNDQEKSACTPLVVTYLPELPFLGITT